jgi:hypothetical protein
MRSQGSRRRKFAERYPGRDEYVSRIRTSARRLVEQRYVLERDLPAILKLANDEWNFVMAAR